MTSLPYKHITVLYHSRDMDGWTSAAILQKRYPGCTIIGYDYGEPIPTIPEQTTWIIMVDVSVEPWQMRQLASIAKMGITHIDHHISSIQKIEDDILHNSGYLIGLIYDLHHENLAACELTWKHCYPTIPVPVYIELIGSADTGRDTKRYPDNKSRDAYLTTLAETFVSPHTCPTWVLENQDDMTSLGHAQLIKQRQERMQYCLDNGVEKTINGLKVLCLEVIKLGVHNFDGIDRNQYDCCIAYMYDAINNVWKGSIYTDENKHNAITIVQQFDKHGGGHPKAAGFTVDDITILLPNEKQ